MQITRVHALQLAVTFLLLGLAPPAGFASDIKSPKLLTNEPTVMLHSKRLQLEERSRLVDLDKLIQTQAAETQRKLVPPKALNSEQQSIQVLTADGACTILVTGQRAICQETGRVYSGVIVNCETLLSGREQCEAVRESERKMVIKIAPDSDRRSSPPIISR
jgi:hypothetical protein